MISQRAGINDMIVAWGTFAPAAKIFATFAFFAVRFMSYSTGYTINLSRVVFLMNDTLKSLN